MLGAAGRYLMGFLPLHPQNGFPLSTLLINLLGAFAIGLIAACAARRPETDPRLLLFLKTGVCGGFTTFSTFSLEAQGLIQAGKPDLAALYALVSAAACIAAVALAQLLVR
jgi:CrcB protein